MSVGSPSLIQVKSAHYDIRVIHGLHAKADSEPQVLLIRRERVLKQQREVQPAVSLFSFVEYLHGVLLREIDYFMEP